MTKRLGRPEKKIDGKVVAAMYYAGATTEEIADYLGVSRDTLERRFKAERLKSKASRKLRLRQAQWKTAVGGSGIPPNPTMQIWLGKQELGQKDVSRQELSDADGKPLPPSIPFYVVRPKSGGNGA
jgi:excisionase family DNA binding protein